ncbi:hypothetical protein VFPPC_14941 [Pochonia chlamydosporia 170]|uniref:Uncharacterized protein n=1 Tax=Pochonia chlamydosporia 170 TaxID=1380566 RepID=A0A179EYQ4_METCM|nr:hypothetical protein VFPPC_14941 [Pochonia chlamydosporia 170]OAQ58311.1 hypothetical protein VFPPC_14941 [Pochonia chlamydosporia 170]
MRFAPLVTVAFAALGGATAAPEEHQEQARADYLAIIFGQPNFRGSSKTISDGESNRCIALQGNLRENVQSILIDRQDRDFCYLYKFRDCGGPSRKFDLNERKISPSNWSYIKCIRGRR